MESRQPLGWCDNWISSTTDVTTSDTQQHIQQVGDCGLFIYKKYTDAIPDSARIFISADGKRFEWRRCRENPSSYDVRTVPYSFCLFTHGFIVYSFLLLKTSELQPFVVSRSQQPLGRHTPFFSTASTTTHC